MPYTDPFILEKQKDCLKLYLEHNGSDHDMIELEMRRLGWENFSRRILYTRNQHGKRAKGWIEALGWKQLLVERFLEMGYERVCKHSPPYEGGVATASADAVVLSAGDMTSSDSDEFVAPRTKNHPAAKAAPLLRKEGSFHAGETGVGKRDACAPVSFHDWLKHVTPNYDWDAKHHKYICEQLAKVDSGEITRLMINVPPRHGKSELVTVRYAAWTLKNDPAKNVIIGSYGQSLANRFSRKIKRVLGDDWVLRRNAGSLPAGDGSSDATGAASIPACEGSSGVTAAEFSLPIDHNATVTFTASSSFITSGCKANLTDPKRRYGGGTGGEQDAHPPVEECPFPFVTSRPKNTEAEWETSKGGGLRAVGVGAGVTGFGADLIIIDDPVKSRAEAESRANREAVWDWFNDDLYTRLEPNGAVILIQTRWHEDDLAGRLLRQMHEGEGEHWNVINLPAIATGTRAVRQPESEPGAIATGSAGGSDPECGGSRPHIKPRVIGFPRLYSRLNDWSASVPLANTGSPGVKAPKSETPDQNEARMNSQSINLKDRHAGGTGVGKRDTCGPVDQIHRQPGESLWPKRFPLEKLEQRRKQIGTYSFSSLYQQQPVPAEGGMFKREWFGQIISAAPPGLRWIRGYDLGVTANADSDFTASFRVAFDKDENMYIDGGFRRRMEFPEQRRYILERLAAEPNTEHCIEATHNGNALAQAVKAERPARAHLVRPITVRDPKTARALEWINIAEQGRLFLVRGAWNEEFIDECCSFPIGTHDDQVDAVSLAVKARRRAKNRLFTF